MVLFCACTPRYLNVLTADTRRGKATAFDRRGQTRICETAHCSVRDVWGDSMSVVDHRLIETDMAIVELQLRWNNEVDGFEYESSTVQETVGSYDASLKCSCGEEFDSLETAREHFRDQLASGEC